MMEKLVIYKGLTGMQVTPESNYNARVQNARKIQKLEWATTAQEVIEYYCQYFGSKPEDFIDMTKQ